MQRFILAVLLSLLAFTTGIEIAFAREGGVEMNLTFEGIDGSAIPELTQPMDILAWSFGAAYSDGTDTDRNGKKIKKGPQFQNISMTKYVEEGSPKLLGLISKGTNIKSATFKAAGKTNEYTLILKNVKVTSLSTGGSGGESRFTENISLSFEQMEYQFKDKSSTPPKESSQVVTTK